MKEARNEIIELVSKMEKRNAENVDDSVKTSNNFLSSRAYIDEDDEGIQYPGSEQ